MKSIFIIIFFLLCLTVVEAQKFSISNETMNVLYEDVPNPLMITVENYSCNSIVVKTDNGNIIGNSCKYIIQPDSVTTANIILYRKVRGQLIEIGRKLFRVKPIPDPVCRIGGNSGGFIVKEVLRNQQFISATYEVVPIDIAVAIDSFSVVILSGDSIMSKPIKNYTGKFSKELLHALTTIRETDTVIFINILVTVNGRRPWKLEPVVFHVTSD